MEWSTAGREVPAGVGRGVSRLGGGGARGSKATERERSRRKKGRAWVLYPLMFVGLTLQPTTISGLAYMVTVVPCVRQPPDKHKLRSSVFKPTNVIRNMNVGPDEYKKLDERMPFSVVQSV
jgi:hypothetical protein